MMRREREAVFQRGGRRGKHQPLRPLREKDVACMSVVSGFTRTGCYTERIVFSRGFAAAGAVGSLFLTVSCGGTASTPVAPTQASITVSVSPNPVTARRCNPLCVAPSGKLFPYEAAMSVSVQESARISGNVDFINVVPVTADGAELPMLRYSSDVLIERSRTNHVGPAGIFTFFFAFFYATGGNNAALTVNISLQFTDDKGNVLTGTAQANVNDPNPLASSGGSSLLAPAGMFAAEKSR